MALTYTVLQVNSKKKPIYIIVHIFLLLVSPVMCVSGCWLIETIGEGSKGTEDGSFDIVHGTAFWLIQ